MVTASWSNARRIRWRVGDVGGEFIMAAAQILDERVPCGG
jgi:hypothetical protein